MLFLTLRKMQQIQVRDLFLTLIVVSSFLPDGAAGIKCYNCEGKECKDDIPTLDCDRQCVTKTKGGSKTEVTRECSMNAEDTCALKEFPSGCFRPNAPKDAEVMKKCFVATGETLPQDKLPSSDFQKVCFCNTDLCNTYELLSKVDPVTVTTGSGSSPSSSGSSSGDDGEATTVKDTTDAGSGIHKMTCGFLFVIATAAVYS